MNLLDFKADLQGSELCTSNINSLNLEDLTQLYNNQLSILIETHCPLITKKVDTNKKKKDPWFDDEVKKFLRKCRIVERKWRKSGLDRDKIEYKQA